MTSEEFDAVVERRVNLLQDVLKIKGREYQRGPDRLSNFKNSAAILRSTPEDALLGQWAKHVSSIVDLIHDLRRGVVADRVVWDEKLGDAINYLILLEGVVVERLGETGRVSS